MGNKLLFDGTKIPEIGLGTWTIGGRFEADYSNDVVKVAAIKEALKLGYRLIDTAESYGAGHCEELVGSAIKGFNRKRLFITTKVKEKNLHYSDLIEAAQASIKRLEVNYVDLYLIHAPNLSIPIKGTMEAMDFLVEKKLAKYIGVSNFTVVQMKKAQQHSDNKIAVNQIEYSLLTRNSGTYASNKDMERLTIPYCQENGIIIQAERPVERGALLKPHPVIDNLASKYKKTRAQIAINWLICKKNVVAIPKSTDPVHLKENLEAAGWRLSDKDIELLNTTDFSSLCD